MWRPETDRLGRPAPCRRALVLVACLPGLAWADDGSDRSLQQLAPPAAAAASRGEPVRRLEWADRLRPAARLTPPRQRPVDAALLQAARAGRWAEVVRLVDAGESGQRADPAVTDDNRANVLVLAAHAGADAAIRALLARGADLERTGEDGFTALGAAAFRGHPSTLRLLLRAGADPLGWGSSGQAGLHLAALAGQVAALDILLRAGVPIEQLNSQRESALDVAGAANQTAAMDRLIQGGADLLMAGRR